VDFGGFSRSSQPNGKECSKNFLPLLQYSTEYGQNQGLCSRTRALAPLATTDICKNFDQKKNLQPLVEPVSV